VSSNKMQKINVLEIIGSLHVGGAEKSLLIFLKNIDRDRFAPVIVAMFWNDQHDFFAESFAKLGFPIYYLKLTSWRDFRTFFALRKIIRRHRIHIAHSHVGALEYFGSLFSRLNGVRLCLYTKHNHRIKTGLAFIFQRILLNHLIVKKILSISRFVTNHLIEREFAPPAKIELIYNPVEFPSAQFALSPQESRRRLNLPENRFLIGNTSRYELVKGFDIFYQTGKQLIEAGKPIHLVVTANDKSVEEHRKLQQRFGVENHATILPFMQDLTEVYCSLDCFLFTSRHTEGFGMVIIEAMSLGLPVIGLNVGVIGEIVRHRKTGLLPFPEKWQEEFLEDNELAARSLANAIQLLIENSGLAHELGQNARDFARQFEARAFTNRIEAIYTKLYHSRFRP